MWACCRADAPYLVGQQNLCATCASGASAIGNAMLDAVFDFIAATGMTLLWDLNGLQARNGTGKEVATSHPCVAVWLCGSWCRG